ncbi:MAG TPA: hypothetical protein ENO19_01225, partial [Halothiobacillaceae bacterium]|nr:hypothetical protein [Halothiobacillaceae bacterium]
MRQCPVGNKRWRMMDKGAGVCYDMGGNEKGFSEIMMRFYRWLSGLVVVWGLCGAAAYATELPAPVADLAARAQSDPRVRTYVRPSRILWHSDEGVQNADVLLQQRSGQVTLDASNPCVLDSRKGDAAILLDFGKELHGGV